MRLPCGFNSLKALTTLFSSRSLPPSSTRSYPGRRNICTELHNNKLHDREPLLKALLNITHCKNTSKKNTSKDKINRQPPQTK